MAAVWSGRGGTGPELSGTRRQPEVGEDGAHDSRVVDAGEDAQPGATPGTGQDIEIAARRINAVQVQAGVGMAAVTAAMPGL